MYIKFLFVLPSFTQTLSPMNAWPELTLVLVTLQKRRHYIQNKIQKYNASEETQEGEGEGA